jgi:hypothetical protein
MENEMTEAEILSALVEQVRVGRLRDILVVE